MANYDVFAKFYDKAMGPRIASTKRIFDLIKKHNPDSEKILELACGTGAVLKPLSKHYLVSGLDLSKSMLKIAKKNIPHATLYHKSMTRFRLPEKFDTILCLFDSINHLLTFEQWENVFINAHSHLRDNGIFIFDMNTREKLQTISTSRPVVLRFGKNLMIMSVTSADGNITDWDICVFEHKQYDTYRRWNDHAKEISFPTKQVEEKLRQIYRKVWIDTAEIKRFNGSDGRVYFCCKK